MKIYLHDDIVSQMKECNVSYVRIGECGGQWPVLIQLKMKLSYVRPCLYIPDITGLICLISLSLS